MKYILKDGYIDEITFGATIECKNQTCTEYTGTIPNNYSSLEEWVIGEEGKLNAWKIVDGNLVFDTAKYDELKEIWENQEKDNALVFHKELYGMQHQIEVIQDISESQYTKVTTTGQVITIDNVKQVYPKVILTNIDPYSFSKIDLITTGKNMFRNEATTQKINGIKFTQNKNRSIKINGTSTAAIEYDIAGTSLNTSAFLCFKKGLNYYLSGLKNQTIKMYYFDGTNRTEIYSGTDGIITFTDSDKLVTQIVISIPNSTTINNVTIYPQLEYGTVSTNYEEPKYSILTFDFSEYIEEGLFPSDDSYYYDLCPAGTTIDYILIEKGNISALINDELVDITNGNVNLYDGYDTIYTFQDTNVEVEYCINNLKLEGTTTKNNNFKVLEDGSIEAHNGFFSGILNAENGDIGGFDITPRSFVSDLYPKKDYTSADQNKLIAYLRGEEELTDEEKELYDVDENGTVDTYDNMLMSDTIYFNITKSNPYKFIIDSKNIWSPIKLIDNEGNIKIAIGPWNSNLGGLVKVEAVETQNFDTTACNTTILLVRENATINGNLVVKGTKNRIASTDNYGNRLLYAYETATPYFGDIGTNTTNEAGYCKIDIENIFKETIETDDYKVFIQELGEGNLYVKKYDNFFEVIGSPNLAFDWELKAIQKGYKDIRLKEFNEIKEEK